MFQKGEFRKKNNVISGYVTKRDISQVKKYLDEQRRKDTKSYSIAYIHQITHCKPGLSVACVFFSLL